ncbi:hypothetical protein C8R44DRAFT_782400 [Mycena epipterygia]|nr:hypothetical protein C8R44DRAFT_782400 [Mycena epipterygia]
MSQPPAKRQRTEATITRSDIWYQDGSIVLQVQDTQFRVHWGVLAQHSSFFRDMQGLPQPPDQPSADDCPIVELSDSATDVEHLLKALYNTTFLLQKALPLPAVASLIRLGRKYDFRDLLDTALERITFENPATLEEYDMLPPKQYTTTRLVDYEGILYDIVTLARENDILSVLPCAYYRAVKYYGRAELFDGVPRGDGTSAFLAPIDQRRCVLGREKLIRTQSEPGYTFAWLRSWTHGDCTDPKTCAEVRDSNMRKCWGSAGLWALSPYSEWKPFCVSCKQHMKEEMVAGRKKIWEELPGFFDLLSWSELKNDL